MSRFLLPLLLLGCAGPAMPGDSPLLVGAAALDITPPVETYEDANGDGRWSPGEPFRDLNGNGKWDPVWLAGFGMGRAALGVHDPVWARAILFEKDGRRALLIACDLVGLLHPRVRRLREKIADVDQVIFCSTHVHSGPDTVGLWGPFPGVTGVSDAYLAQLEAAVVEVARRALASRRPATLTAAETRVEGVCKDVRPPDLRNETAAALLARGLDGKPIAVLVNFAMHPEGLWKTNRMISSDYPHYLRERIERDFPGATALFVSADLGGMQTPDVKEHTHEEVRRCGETIALRARDALAGAATSDVRELKFESRALDLPLENRRFLAAFQFGAFGKDLGATLRSSGDGVALRSEISALRLGDILFVTVPGEALPEVGREIFALMDARHKFLVGLGQDEVGYLLPKEDFDPKKYEESMSLGPQTAPTLLDALKKLLKGF